MPPQHQKETRNANACHCTSLRLAGALVLALLGASQTAVAYELYADEDSHLNADLLAVWGMFNSRKNYDGTPGGSTWREGFIKYGVSGDQGLAGNGSLYGALNWVSSGAWGDGDAGGNRDGSERTTKIEDAYLGWRSGDMFPLLGKDGVDISGGRQVIHLGSGFLINDDGPNLGKGPADGALNRGGGFYLGARHAFDRTAMLRLGGQDGLHGSVLWLKSDNRARRDRTCRRHPGLHPCPGHPGPDLDTRHRRHRPMGQRIPESP